MRVHYLIFTDIEYNGYVVNICDNLPTSKIIMSKIWELGNPPTPFSMEDLIDIFTDKSIAKYELDEDHLFYEKALTDQSNGFYTVGIVELNDDFTVEDYLNSREKK